MMTDTPDEQNKSVPPHTDNTQLADALDASSKGKGLWFLDDSGDTIQFSFKCLGFSFKGEVVGEKAPYKIHLNGFLGHIPFSIESKEKRQNVINALANIRLVNGQVKINDNKIFYHAILILDDSMTAHSIISEAAVAIVQVTPYLKKIRPNVQ